MEKWKNTVKFLLCILFMLSICALLLVTFPFYLLLYVPIDYIRYRRSAFFRNTRRKYEHFQTTGQYYKIYNYLAQRGTPPQFFPREGLESYFLIDEEIFFSYQGGDPLRLLEGVWYFDCEPGEEESFPDDREGNRVDNELAYYTRTLPPEHQYLPCRFLTFRPLCSEEFYAQARQCPYFYCID